MIALATRSTTHSARSPPPLTRAAPRAATVTRTTADHTARETRRASRPVPSRARPGAPRAPSHRARGQTHAPQAPAAELHVAREAMRAEHEPEHRRDAARRRARGGVDGERREGDGGASRPRPRASGRARTGARVHGVQHGSASRRTGTRPCPRGPCRRGSGLVIARGARARTDGPGGCRPRCPTCRRPARGFPRRPRWAPMDTSIAERARSARDGLC